MTLGKYPEWMEVLLLILFLLLYLFFFFRVAKVARQLPNPLYPLAYKFVLRTTYLLLILVAFLAPSFGEVKKEIKAIGKDIYILVDLSQSMDATDIQPSRLEKVKFELKNIIKAFSSDRIGLIIFSSDAFVQCPLTYDANALSLFVQTLSTNLISHSGTDFYPAMKMALEKLTAEETASTRAQSKVMLVVSDGEDFGYETAAMANQIQQAGIRVFTLGVGTEKGSKIPSGYRFKRDKEGNDVVTRLNADALKNLADLTGGKYFEISDQRNDVNRLINAVNLIEGELRQSRKVDAAANKYFYFLAVALFLMALDALTVVKIVKI